MTLCSFGARCATTSSSVFLASSAASFFAITFDCWSEWRSAFSISSLYTFSLVFCRPSSRFASMSASIAPLSRSFSCSRRATSAAASLNFCVAALSFCCSVS